MNSTRNQSSVFTYSPNYDLIGVILNQAASPGNSTHVKTDNTRYSYAGRSYGIGSSVGLVDQDLSQNTNLSYEYIETGYLTEVSCIVNSSSAWLFAHTEYTSEYAAYPNIYLLNGTLANGNLERYAACGLQSSDYIFALVGSSNNGNNIFSIAAGRNYTAFDKVQCSVDFKPTNFRVAANRTDLLISVNPLNSTQDTRPQDIEPTGNITDITMCMPTSFSQQHACDLYTSLVGNTFSQNIESTNPDFHPYFPNNDSHVADQVLRGVEDSLTSMLDNSLLAFSTAQLMIAKDTKPVPVSITVSAVRIDKSAYIHATAAINFAILLLCFVELVRTGNWRGLSKFDYTSIKSVTVGASKGGVKVAEEARKLHQRNRSGKMDVGGEVGKIKVQLEGAGEDLKLVGVSGENGESERARGCWRRHKMARPDTEMESFTPKYDPVD